jgi:pyruvate/2-oxoglutarate dehydrogenase complex dihydrolipoamide dehydrogenase (E3) component
MSQPAYDLAIVGAGAAGLTAADFALKVGARVALLEQDRIGGDCTWTGCVPSKSLLKVAGVAAAVRKGPGYGVSGAQPAIDLLRVREYLRSTQNRIYAPTSPGALVRKGLAVHPGAAHFVASHALDVAGARIEARRVLICTGADPRRPALPGLHTVPYLTYREIFENDRLPATLTVIGGGPLGCEVAQSYQRLGARVTIIAPRLLPRAEPEVSRRLSQVFAQEGLRHVRGRASAVRQESGRILVDVGEERVSGELLLVAVGRSPRVGGLALERAGVRYSERGIEVNVRLETSARHVYAAGDCIGGAQYSHLAAWQAFQAVRNALLPGSTRALARAMPEVTYTAPEVAQVGLTEQAARERFGDRVRVGALDLTCVDRAVSEDDGTGLVKLVARRDGRILGATVMGERAGEALTELCLAVESGLTLGQVASCIHPYPTYSSGIQMLASQLAVRAALTGMRGRLARGLSRRVLRGPSVCQGGQP